MAEDDPFLAEAERRGLMTAAQVEDCRRIATAIAEVALELSIDEIATRKGFVTSQQVAEIRRALARQRVGRYEVLERLGEGSAGVVWKARDTKLDRVVALKVLSQKAQTSASFRERFLREARIAVTLNHVNIVRGLDYGEADGYQYFAMEFVEGENAEQRLSHVGRIPERDAAAMALDVVHALAYVQKFQIVHRDIKPGNLLLTPTGHVKVGDLGLAKPMLMENELLAGDGGTAGTPYYMSPEQIREPEKIDWRSDVYSLGATLYHLLTGVPPFRPDDKLGVIQKHLKEKPRNPREHVLEITDGMASVVMRMLQKKPEDRYAALEELAGDLESVLAGRQPLHTAPPLPPEEATAERHARVAVARRITEKNLPRERFPMFGVAALVLFAIAAGTVWMTLGGDKQKAVTPPVTASRPPEPATSRPVQASPEPTPTTPAPKSPSTTTEPGLDLVLVINAKSDADRRIDKAKRLVEDGNQFKAAFDELKGFPEKYRKTPAQKLIDTEIARIDGVVAHGRFDELVKKAKSLARRGRLTEAIDLMKEAAKIEAPWADGDAKAAQREVEELAQVFERNRDQQAAKFAEVYGRVLLVAGKDGVEAARKLLGGEAAELDAYTAETSALREDLDLLAQYGTDPQVINNEKERGATALVLAWLAAGDVEHAEAAVDSVRTTGGDVDDARERISRVRGVLVADASAKLATAETRRAAGALVDADRLVQEVVRAMPHFAPARVLQARIAFEQGNPLQASRLAEEVLRRPSPPADAHLWLGEALAKMGEDLSRAESELKRFLEVAERDDPLRARAETLRADVHRRRVDTDVKQWREVARKTPKVAETAWGRVLELLPDDPEALIALGRMYLKKRPSHAFAVATRAGKIATLSPQQRKDVDELLGKPELKGMGYQSGDGPGLADAAETSYEREDWTRAIQGFQSALAFAPYLDTARLHLVRSLVERAREAAPGDATRESDARDAVANADILLRLYADKETPPALRADATPAALRSEAKLVLEDLPNARDDARLAVGIDPKNALAQLAWGHVWIEGKDGAKAIEGFRQANSLEPSPQALLGMASAYLLLDDRDGARAALDNFRQLYGVPRAWNREYTDLMKRVDGK